MRDWITIAVVSLFVCAALAALVDQWVECARSGGVAVRGVVGIECLRR